MSFLRITLSNNQSGQPVSHLPSESGSGFGHTIKKLIRLPSTGKLAVANLVAKGALVIFAAVIAASAISPPAGAVVIVTAIALAIFCRQQKPAAPSYPKVPEPPPVQLAAQPAPVSYMPLHDGFYTGQEGIVALTSLEEQIAELPIAEADVKAENLRTQLERCDHPLFATCHRLEVYVLDADRLHARRNRIVEHGMVFRQNEKFIFMNAYLRCLKLDVSLDDTRIFIDDRWHPIIQVDIRKYELYKSAKVLSDLIHKTLNSLGVATVINKIIIEYFGEYENPKAPDLNLLYKQCLIEQNQKKQEEAEWNTDFEEEDLPAHNSFD